MIWFFIFLLTLIILAITALLYHNLLNISSPPYVPTINKKVKKIIIRELKNSNISTFYELGCGTAEISFFVKKNFPKIKVIAIEHDIFIYLIIRLKGILLGSKIKFYRKDIQKFNFKNKKSPSLMYCYLYPKYMDYLYHNQKFYNNKVISLDFEIQGIKPENKIILNKFNFQKQILIYNFLSK